LPAGTVKTPVAGLYILPVFIVAFVKTRTLSPLPTGAVMDGDPMRFAFTAVKQKGVCQVALVPDVAVKTWVATGEFEFTKTGEAGVSKLTADAAPHFKPVVCAESAINICLLEPTGNLVSTVASRVNTSPFVVKGGV
jgi:hypothetical protein